MNSVPSTVVLSCHLSLIYYLLSGQESINQNNEVTTTLVSEKGLYSCPCVTELEFSSGACCGGGRQKLSYMICLQLFIYLLFSSVLFSLTYCSHYDSASLRITRCCRTYHSHIPSPCTISDIPYLILQLQVYTISKKWEYPTFLKSDHFKYI